MALNQSKTALLSVESGFDFLGYHFDKRGKTVPEKAEAGLQERLEAIWLTDRPLPLNEKLKKGAEILGGWEQYYNEEREIASSCEFAVVAYMMWNKEADIERLQKSRESFRNSNREICLYLCSFWEKFSHRRMALYEMEDFQGIADMDRDIEISDIYIDELSELYRSLMDGETEELLVNIMQVYSDVGAFMKAAALMDRVSRLHALSGREPSDNGGISGGRGRGTGTRQADRGTDKDIYGKLCGARRYLRDTGCGQAWQTGLHTGYGAFDGGGAARAFLWQTHGRNLCTEK